MKYFVLALSLLTLAGCSSAEKRAEKERSPQDVVITMVNAIDTKDWNRALRQFDKNVFVDYSSMTGQPGAETRSKALVEGWAGLLKNAETHHMLTNFEVSMKSRRAKVSSHVYASHTAEGVEYWDIYGRYHHELKKTSKGWKITSKTLIVHGQKGNLKFLEQVPEIR